MSILVHWGNEQKTYTVVRYENTWTWEEYHQSINKAYELVKDYPYTVNILLDMMECHLLPQNLLSNIGGSMQMPPKAFDLVVVATSSKFVEMLGHAIERLYGSEKTRFQITKSLEDARQILEEYDRLHRVSSRIQLAAIDAGE